MLNIFGTIAVGGMLVIGLGVNDALATSQLNQVTNTITVKDKGTVTISGTTIKAEDGNSGSLASSQTLLVTGSGAATDITLSGTYNGQNITALNITASGSNDAKLTVSDTLTVTGNTTLTGDTGTATLVIDGTLNSTGTLTTTSKSGSITINGTYSGAGTTLAVSKDAFTIAQSGTHKASLTVSGESGAVTVSGLQSGDVTIKTGQNTNLTVAAGGQIIGDVSAEVANTNITISGEAIKGDVTLNGALASTALTANATSTIDGDVILTKGKLDTSFP